MGGYRSTAAVAGRLPRIPHPPRIRPAPLRGPRRTSSCASARTRSARHRDTGGYGIGGAAVCSPRVRGVRGRGGVPPCPRPRGPWGAKCALYALGIVGSASCKVCPVYSTECIIQCAVRGSASYSGIQCAVRGRRSSGGTRETSTRQKYAGDEYAAEARGRRNSGPLTRTRMRERSNTARGPLTSAASSDRRAGLSTGQDGSRGSWMPV